MYAQTPNKRMEPTLDPVLPALSLLSLLSVRLKCGSSLVLCLNRT